MTEPNAQRDYLPRKRVRACGPRAIVSFVFITILLLGYLYMSTTLWTRRKQKYFSAFDEKEQFLRAVGTFSSMHATNRFIAGQDYLRAEGLEEVDRDLLRFFFQDYLEFHKKNERTWKRTLIFRPQNAGNGDRFKCMMFAYWAAVLSKRIFVLDWDEPFPISLFLKSPSGAKLFLDAKLKKTPLPVVDECVVPDCIVLGRHNFEGDHFENALVSKTKLVIFNSNKFPRTYLHNLVQYNKPEQLDEFIVREYHDSENFKRAVLHHVLSLSDSMVEDHKTISQTLGLTSGTVAQEFARNGTFSWKSILNFFEHDTRRYIGVHARLGKGVGESRAGRFKEVAVRMKDMAMCLASRAVRLAVMSGSPPLPVFLATDTAEFRHVFQSAVRRISGDDVSVVFGNWSIMHVAKVSRKDMNTTGKGHNKAWEAMWGAFMDSILLGHAEHIVALYSGFPRVALSLGDAKTLTELRNNICI